MHEKVQVALLGVIYDTNFRQQAADTPGLLWASIEPGIYSHNALRTWRKTHLTSGVKHATRWTTPQHIVPPCPHKRFRESTRKWHHSTLEWMRWRSARTATPRVAHTLTVLSGTFAWTAVRNTHFQTARSWHWPRWSDQATNPPCKQPCGSINSTWLLHS